MLKLLKIIFLIFTFSFAYPTYTIPLQKEKSLQIQKATKLYQYIYDLKKLNETLQMLYQNAKFKNITETAELSVKNIDSKYSYEYIEVLLKVLNGEDGRSGYIRFIEDKFYKYKSYLINFPKNELITKNFDIYKQNIENSLKNLDYNKNVRPILKIIFENLIFALEEISKESDELKKLGVIKPFTNEDDERYSMPKNWAQTDGNTIFSDIVNFILKGDKKYNFYGLNYYYDKIYENDTKPLFIRR